MTDIEPKVNPRATTPKTPRPVDVWLVERAKRRLCNPPLILTTASPALQRLVRALDAHPDGLERDRIFDEFTSKYEPAWAEARSRVDIYRPPLIEPAPRPSALAVVAPAEAEQPRPKPRPTTPRPEAADVEPLITKSALAVAMAISTRQLDRLIASGEFPRPDMIIGRAPRWRPATYTRWLASGGVR